MSSTPLSALNHGGDVVCFDHWAIGTLLPGPGLFSDHQPGSGLFAVWGGGFTAGSAVARQARTESLPEAELGPVAVEINSHGSLSPEAPATVFALISLNVFLCIFMTLIVT